MTAPSDRARNAAADYYDTVGSRLTSGWKHAQAIRIGARDADPLVQLFATFERETPGFAAGVEAEPVAWLHTMHQEGEQKYPRVSHSEENPFGKPGVSYSAEYRVTSEPLFRNLTPAPPADLCADIAQKSGDGIARLEAENARLRKWARKVSVEFVGLSGGGSEMFTRIGDDFYVDPVPCVTRVKQKMAARERFARATLTNAAAKE